MAKINVNVLINIPKKGNIPSLFSQVSKGKLVAVKLSQCPE